MDTIYRKDTKLNTRVEIKTNTDGGYGAFMKQDYKGETDLLAFREFKTLSGAQKWANKILA